MDDWIEDLFKEIIWGAIAEFYTDIATWSEEKIETELKNLEDEVGKPKPLSSSPLVRVSSYTATVDPDVDHITFLVRGRVPLFKGVESVFMRVEVTVSTDIDLLSGDWPIEIVDWHTIIGDLKISKKNVFSANLGFGYDDGVWLGRGAIKILPAGFGLDVYLGGLSDRGAMIGLSIDLPAPIPLGSSGLGLAGMGGDFAYNFIARLEESGIPVTDPTAKHYVDWARNVEALDRWEVGPIEQTAVGIGINTDLITLADNGHVIKLEPIGLAVLTPGPVFILGGVGKLLNTNSARIEGYVAVDVASHSMALGLGVNVMIPKPKEGSSFKKNEKYLVNAKGTLDAFFSFDNPSAWFVNLGTEEKQIAAKVISDLIRSELYFMINHYRFAFGAGLSIGGKWEWWIITLIARVGAAIAAKVGWNPVLLEGLFRIWGELGIKVWKFGFILRGTAEVLGYTPDPTKLDVTFKYKLDLPWPVPDIKGDKTFTLGDETPAPPIVAAPLLAGSSSIESSTMNGPMKLGLLHTLSSRQWDLDPASRDCWPDVEIVVPFSSRVIDKTSKVVGSAVSAPVEGGYVVKHELNELKLLDVSGGSPGVAVGGLQGVWVAGPGGDTARLHVLGQDPFSWVVPHGDTSETTIETPGKTVEQLLGYGMAESFTKEKRFGEMLVSPLRREAKLVTYFQPVITTRVLSVRKFGLRFRTMADEPIHVEEVTLYLLSATKQELVVSTNYGMFSAVSSGQIVYDSIHIIAVTIPISPVSDRIEMEIANSKDKEPLLIYAVRYREARQASCNWQSKTVLKPGKYEISLAGESIATHPSSGSSAGGGLPSSKKTTWSVKDTFNVDYPETLRPYIHYTTIGDNRIFFDEKLSWNPTMYGFGFPIYQKYHGMVRFLVPYLDKIFSTINFRLTYETGEMMEQELTPVPNGSGETYMLGSSQEWIERHCGVVESGEEIVFSMLFPKSGPASVALYFEHPDGKEKKLDDWSCYISQFDSFADHLSWNHQCLAVSYGPGGRTERTCCPLLTAIKDVESWQRSRKGNRIDPIFTETAGTRPSSLVNSRQPLLERVYPIEIEEPFPEELSTPPASWRLPFSMTNWLQALDGVTGYRFSRFASATGVRFNTGTGDTLDGINDTVDQTTVEAVVDSQGRPLALWVRTPEPVDWRRVSLKLRIQHVEYSGDCPTGYEKRNPLDLSIEILPSPDASSAFLIGSLAGHRSRLPRGEYTLTFTFDTKLPSLPHLRPTLSIGSGPEHVTMKFIQPFGERWPLLSTDIEIPAHLLDRLTLLYKIDWPIIDLLLDPHLTDERFKELTKTLPLMQKPQEELDRLTDRLEEIDKRLIQFEASEDHYLTNETLLDADEAVEQHTIRKSELKEGGSE